MPCNMIEIKPVNTIRSFIAKKIRRFRHLISLPLKKVVGMTGLEPATSRPPRRVLYHLSYIPDRAQIYCEIEFRLMSNDV